MQMVQTGIAVDKPRSIILQFPAQLDFLEEIETNLHVMPEMEEIAGRVQEIMEQNKYTPLTIYAICSMLVADNPVENGKDNTVLPDMVEYILRSEPSVIITNNSDGYTAWILTNKRSRYNN